MSRSPLSIIFVWVNLTDEQLLHNQLTFLDIGSDFCLHGLMLIDGACLHTAEAWALVKRRQNPPLQFIHQQDTFDD